MSQLRKLDVSAVGDRVDICAGVGSLLPSPARDWPVGRLSTSSVPAPVTGVTPSVQPGAGPPFRRGGAPHPGGGLDPGGARTPSRQRQSALAADGTEPVRRVVRALFPLPCERRKRRGDPQTRVTPLPCPTPVIPRFGSVAAGRYRSGERQVRAACRPVPTTPHDPEELRPWRRRRRPPRRRRRW